jgi:hypothetical protein
MTIDLALMWNMFLVGASLTTGGVFAYSLLRILDKLCGLIWDDIADFFRKIRRAENHNAKR